MQNISIAITSDPVPSGFCALSDATWQALVGLLTGLLTGDPSINVGNATPTPDRRGLPWFRLNSDGSPDGWYGFNNGLWLQRHPDAPGKIVVYDGALADIPTFDGGNANAISEIDGAFWQRLTALDARMPLQAGTLASGKVLNMGDTGGEELHILKANELPKHSHPMANADLVSPKTLLTSSNYVTVQSNFDGAGASNSYYLAGSATLPTLGQSGIIGGKDGNDGDDLGHNNLPPYGVICFIKRTSRLYRTQNA